MDNPRTGDIVKHLKSGGFYTVIGVGAHSESEEKLVVYLSSRTQKIWVRPYDMFCDGRFVLMVGEVP